MKNNYEVLTPVEKKIVDYIQVYAFHRTNSRTSVPMSETEWVLREIADATKIMGERWHIPHIEAEKEVHITNIK